MVSDILFNLKDPVETEKRFAKRILSVVDYNEDGQLSFSEFSDLIRAFGNLVAANKVPWLLPSLSSLLSFSFLKPQV